MTKTPSLIWFIALFLEGCSWFTSPDGEGHNPELRLLWEHQYEHVGSSISSTPLVLGDSLVVMSAGRELWLVEQVSGIVRWQTFVSNETNIQTDEFRSNGSLVFATHVEDVRAYSLADGSLVWKTSMTNERGAFFSRTMDYAQGRVSIAGTRTLYSLDASTGSVLWQRTISPTHIVYGVTSHNGMLLWSGDQSIPDSSGGGSHIVPQIGALDLLTGDSLWTTTFQGGGGIIMPPLVEDGFVFAGTAYEGPSSFECLKASDGTRIWALQTPQSFTHYESAASNSDRVFTSFGLYGVQALSKSDGHTIWQNTPVQNFETRDLLFYDGVVYRTQGWKLYMFDAVTGKTLIAMTGPKGQALVTIAAGNKRIFVQGHPSIMCYESFLSSE